MHGSKQGAGDHWTQGVGARILSSPVGDLDNIYSQNNNSQQTIGCWKKSSTEKQQQQVVHKVT